MRIIALLLLSTLVAGCGSDSSDPPPVVDPEVIPTTPGEPPTTEPPVTQPPTGQPVLGSPVTEPPVGEPPVTEPPVTEPPVGEPPVVDPPVAECSVLDKNQTVEAGMRDFYYFYDQVPTLNLADYESPEVLIRNLRFNEKDTFSYVGDQATQQALFEEGKSFGFGFRLVRDSDDQARIALVYRDSPFGIAGVKRGHILVSMNGVPWTDISEAQYLEMIGPDDAPNLVQFVFQDTATGETLEREIRMAEYVINTVITAQTIINQSQAQTYGYLMFQSFLETSIEELDSAMSFFKREGITDLILDLRYNGGGRVSIARKLASQIGGDATEGKLLTSYQFNDKYTAENFSYNFEAEVNDLDLSRVIVITTDRTASASELVINSLRAHMEVVTIGGTSTGKPYISYGRNFCDKTMNAIEAEGVNANSVSVFGGIPATCVSSDNPIHDFGIEIGATVSLNDMDSMLADSLRYVSNGTCNTSTAVAGRNRLGTDIALPHDNMPEGAFEVR